MSESQVQPVTLYIILSYYEWQEFKRSGSIPQDTLYSVGMRTWLKEQVYKRSNHDVILNQTSNVTTQQEPMYCFVQKPDPHTNFPQKHVVCKVRVTNPDSIVYFDDNMYVHVLNSFDHLWFCSYTEAEDKEKNDDMIISKTTKRTKEECLQSFERMFDVCPEHAKKEGRQNWWVGPMELRAFIPYLTRDMIRKVWVYRGNGKRLRR